MATARGLLVVGVAALSAALPATASAQRPDSPSRSDPPEQAQQPAQPQTPHGPTATPNTEPRSPQASPRAANPTPPSTPADGAGPPGKAGSAPGQTRRQATPAGPHPSTPSGGSRTGRRRAAGRGDGGRDDASASGRSGGAGAGIAGRGVGRRKGVFGPLAATPALTRPASSASGEAGSEADADGNAFDRFVDNVPDWSRPIIAVLVALVLVLWLRSTLSAARARRLKRQTAQLTDDFAVMQAALVPELPDRLGALVASVAYRPADGPATGGDFYDVFELDGGKVAIVAGDASGHGREAVARATAVRFRLRAYLEVGLSPREALRSAGRVVAVDPDDAAFATAVLAVYDPAANALAYACAGHPPPIIAGGGGHEPVTACASPAIGWGFPTGLRETWVRLDSDSIACFYTDGLVEARRDGALIGRAALEELVVRLSPDGDAAAVIDGVREMADDAPDDMAALVLRVATPRLGDSLRREELEVMPDELREGMAETFLHACGLDGDEVLRAMKVVKLAARGGRAVLVRVEIGQDAVAVEALERLGDDVKAPPFIKAAPESRVELARSGLAAAHN